MIPKNLGDWPELREWFIALGVVATTAIALVVGRTLLGRLTRKQPWARLTPLIPYLTALILIVGIDTFTEVAPLNPKLARLLDNGAYVTAVLLGLAVLRRALLITLEWSALKSTQSKTLQLGFIPLLRNLITVFIFLTGTIMVLQHFHYDVMSLLAALGVGSLAVGLAAKDTLSNMISGFTLIIDRNLKPGDKVNLGGSIGEVDEIGLRSTRIRTGDGNMLIVPNSDLVNTKIVNLSIPAPDTTCSTTIRVPIDASFGHVEELCKDAILAVSRMKKDRGYWVHLASLSQGYQLIQMGFWVSSLDDQGAAISELNENLLARFLKARIPLIGESPLITAPR